MSELLLALIWRLAAWVLFVSVVEHQIHVWILHSRRFLKTPYRNHHVDHHGRGMNDLRPHIDLAFWDYGIVYAMLFPVAYRAVFVTPYAWLGVVSGVLVATGHRYLWSRLHRATHRRNDHLFRAADLVNVQTMYRGARLEDNWTVRQWWFPAFEMHHLRHHANPSCNYAVVCLWTDWMFGTSYKETDK